VEEQFCVLSQPGISLADLGIPYNIFDDDDDIGGADVE